VPEFDARPAYGQAERWEAQLYGLIIGTVVVLKRGVGPEPRMCRSAAANCREQRAPSRTRTVPYIVRLAGIALKGLWKSRLIGAAVARITGFERTEISYPILEKSSKKVDPGHPLFSQDFHVSFLRQGWVAKAEATALEIRPAIE
jgi:hypothetical protein